MLFLLTPVLSRAQDTLSRPQTDLTELALGLFGRRPFADTGKARYRTHVSLVPAAGYTLQTGFAGILAANCSFYTLRDSSQRLSSISTNFTYTAKNQTIIPLQANIWTRHNKYYIFIDWRYMRFPSQTYGLGGYTKDEDGYDIDYFSVRAHQVLFRRIKGNLYFGLGYNQDYFWNIRELNPPSGGTDFEQYGGVRRETARAFTFNLLYDSRTNPNNPERGQFINLIYRPNIDFFNNRRSWRSFTADLRTYIPFPTRSANVLALWSYNWLTLSGKPPYLMLPNTGGDPYGNTGRGYINGRFRGLNMLYAEAEYRYRLTRNGLFGGVVFANLSSFTEKEGGRFETLLPACGAGIRIKVNKFSRTNIAIDYGINPTGKGGFFVNLGEVF